MNKQAIFHQPKSNYCYAYNKDTIHIRLRAAKGDLDSVILVYGDKYDWDNNRESSMEITYSDKLFDYFTVSIKAPNNRLSYYFILKKGNETGYYTEIGFFENLDNEDIYIHFFNYPYVNEGDIHIVPEWVKDAVFYQIFPERFSNGDKSNDTCVTEEWGSLPKSDSFFGGDLRGIIDNIDHIVDLGINAIYLNPVFESDSNHKYDTIDYYKIDPHFGDLETMKELVDKCHSKGIKVIFDAVFNHSGYNFKPFQHVLENGDKSHYYNWFHINKLPIEIEPPSYETFAFTYKMPKLNVSNDEVKKYLLGVAEYWIKEVGIDGWRLDVADEVEHDFWRDFRKVIKKANKDAYIVGEIWHDSLPWLMGDQFDAIMNYPVTRVCLKYFAQNSIKDIDFMESIDKAFIKNTYQVNEVMLNLLDSHDTPRFLTECNGNYKKLLLAISFLMTYIGAPCIYYGTEIGLEGGKDPDCRRTMIWDKSKWNDYIYSSIKKLISLRREHEALRRGKFKWLKYLNGVLGYTRESGNEKVLVLINNSNQIKNVNLIEYFNKCVDLLNNKKVVLKEGKMDIIMDEYSYKIFSVL